MSTRSHIGTIDKTGNISAVYCHFDGYPSHMLPELLKYIKTFGMGSFANRIDQAQKAGGFRGFDDNGCTLYNDGGGPGWIVTKESDLNNCYAYLFSIETGDLERFYRYSKRASVKDAYAEAGLFFLIEKQEESTNPIDQLCLELEVSV